MVGSWWEGLQQVAGGWLALTSVQQHECQPIQVQYCKPRPVKRKYFIIFFGVVFVLNCNGLRITLIMRMPTEVSEKQQLLCTCLIFLCGALFSYLCLDWHYLWRQWAKMNAHNKRNVSDNLPNNSIIGHQHFDKILRFYFVLPIWLEEWVQGKMAHQSMWLKCHPSRTLFISNNTLFNFKVQQNELEWAWVIQYLMQ